MTECSVGWLCGFKVCGLDLSGSRCFFLFPPFVIVPCTCGYVVRCAAKLKCSGWRRACLRYIAHLLLCCCFFENYHSE